MKVEYLIAEIGSTTTLVTAFNFKNGVEVIGQGKAFTSVLQGDVTLFSPMVTSPCSTEVKAIEDA